MSRARSGVSSTKALSARAFAMAAEMRVGKFERGKFLFAQRVARLRQRERSEIGHSPVGSSQENGLLAAGFARRRGGRLRRRLVPIGLHRQRLNRKCRKQRVDGRRVVGLQQTLTVEISEPDGVLFAGEAHHSTTLGTKKK